MENERVDIAPTFSFKPIDDDGNTSVLSSSSSQHDGDGNNNNLLMDLCLSADIFQAGRNNTPADIGKHRHTREDEAMDDASAFRVISPYPFSHTSQEELSEREQLSDAFRWTLRSTNNSDDFLTCKVTNAAVQVDNSSFFGRIGDQNDAVMEDCDDFSLSIQDADSLSRDLCLEDPASFWEDGASTIPSTIFIVRTNSPTEISLGSDDEAQHRTTPSLRS